MKAIIVVAAVVMALLVLAMIVTGGEHGPARHLGSGCLPVSASGVGR